MKSTIEQVEKGIAAYLDSELMPHLEGWKQWVAGAAVTMALQNGAKAADVLKENEVIKAMGVFEGDDIDIDMVYEALSTQAKKCPAVLQLPLIGTVTLRASDVDKLYGMIEKS